MKKTASLFMLVASISMVLCFSAFAEGSLTTGTDVAVANVAHDGNVAAGTDGNRTMGTNGYGTNNMGNNFRTTATTGTRTYNWGWLGMLGLIGLAGLRGRNSERT